MALAGAVRVSRPQGSAVAVARCLQALRTLVRLQPLRRFKLMLTEEETQKCLALLRKARELDPQSEAFLALEQEAAFLRKAAKKKRRGARHQAASALDRSLKRSTALAHERLGVPEQCPKEQPLNRQVRCYCCGKHYRELHGHFHCLCSQCGDDALVRRKAGADLRGRVALVTGGRIKVGFHIALRLLEFGAEVHVTSRFPKDTARRYAEQIGFKEWGARLHIHALDFRDLPALVGWIHGAGRAARFDIVINNAAQTIWHPPEYYRQLWAREEELALPLADAIVAPSHPAGEASNDLALNELVSGLTRFGDPIDLRRENSWVQELGEIAPVELLESQVVNNMAPFLICNGLLESMATSRFEDRYIVNVAAAEGQFERKNKPARHPHTNMAKAALNMLTRTSAERCAEKHVYMVSVDPGWVSHEVPHDRAVAATARGFHTPLEMADAAARLLHPILSGLNGEPIYGKLLKDFRVVPW